MSADGDLSPDAPTSEGREGKRLGGRYQLLRLIGRGGMGEVYAARNEVTGREVALKMIRAADATPEQNRRFLREAKAATAIRHRNVIDILDVFEDVDGTPVMVMELLTGSSLRQLSERTGPLALHQVATVFLPVISALRTAHAKGIVHRDLKPDNIFLSEEPGGEVVPKVLDFGIAKVIDPTTLDTETRGSQTNTGSILGTPHYMSFEQAMSEKAIDHRADIWAVGVMLFEALTGRRPLEFENLGQMYAAFLQGEVPSIRESLPELPAEVGEIIDRCLVKEREGRLDDLNAVLAVLRPYAEAEVAMAIGTLSQEPIPALAEPVPTGNGTQGTFAATVDRPSRRPLAVVLGVALTLLVGAGASLLLLGSGADQAAPQVGAGSGGGTSSTSEGVADEAPRTDTPPAPAAVGTGVEPEPSATTRSGLTATTPAGPRRDSAGAAGAQPPRAKSAAPMGSSTAQAASGAATSTASASAAAADAPGRRGKGIAAELPY